MFSICFLSFKLLLLLLLLLLLFASMRRGPHRWGAPHIIRVGPLHTGHGGPPPIASTRVRGAPHKEASTWLHHGGPLNHHGGPRGPHRGPHCMRHACHREVRGPPPPYTYLGVLNPKDCCRGGPPKAILLLLLLLLLQQGKHQALLQLQGQHHPLVAAAAASSAVLQRKLQQLPRCCRGEEPLPQLWRCCQQQQQLL